ARAARIHAGATADDAPQADAAQPSAMPERYADLIAGWAADADLLLAERSRRLPDGPIPVDLPRRFGVSALVAMAKDPAQLAARPRPGRNAGRRSTAGWRNGSARCV